MIPNFEHYKKKWGIESETAIKPGLQSMREALHRLGNPQQSLQVIHVAGTNGKGSTICFLEQFALNHGLSVGKFMSPCIVDVHDQIQINGTSITPTELDALFSQVKQHHLSGLLTDFELLTCIAFLHFYNQKVDLVLLETGMGGKEDSTNVITPLVSVITSIALEHTKFLGNTIQEIATHKAGIIKERKPVVIGYLDEDARKVVYNKAREKNAKVYELGKDFSISIASDGDTYIQREQNIEIPHIKRKMIGNHQSSNMALAITAFLEAAKQLEIPVHYDKIKDAAKKAQLPGRFEQVYPHVYFDGAHNPASVETLVDTIQLMYPKTKVRFIVGILADKNVKQVLKLLEKVSDEFYFVDFENPRAMTAETLMSLSKAHHKQIVKHVAKLIPQFSAKEGVTIVTGSLYLLAEIRRES